MDVTVNHCLTKIGGGSIPLRSELSEIEANDIRTFLTFLLEWDTSESEEVEAMGARIIRIEFIYDGIAGRLRIEDGAGADCIKGYPAPTIRYTLDRDVNPEEFKRCVWRSSVRYQPESRIQSGEEPCYAEDHNGYTAVVDCKEVSSEYAASGVLISTVFEFPGGLESCEWRDFPALEYALPPS